MTNVFDDRFNVLAGQERALSWQRRLFDQWCEGCLKPVIDLPTGLGKTMVMAIWLLAREANPELPRRLVYVVDRRTVVDQATDLATLLQKQVGVDQLAVSTLRGQLADNRKWSEDPSRPAIIIGTIDLIGSALLFSGYRSSYKRRPLEAGLLGQDSLLILDEAHLSKPFEKLIKSISAFQKSNDKPMRVIRMSATGGDSIDSKPPFTLLFDADGNLAGEDAKDSTIAERFSASKTLSIVEADKTADAIATQADDLATKKPGSRIVIFVRTPDLVQKVREAIEKKDKGYATRLAQLTGTMRGLERDELVDAGKPLGKNDHERRVMQRFLKHDNDPSQGNCLLISTSAGEVGFDLNADHMVCDGTTIDSLIQRLGRVNRRGKGTATVILVREMVKKKDGKPVEHKGLELAIANTLKLLEGVTDVSPKNIASLKASATWRNKANDSKSAYENACTPEPITVDLTDILLDNWSMTSIAEPMPGRPEVGPWLRGIAEWEPPRTEVAWRAELDLDGFTDLDLGDVEDWFDTHRILTHEVLSEKTSAVATWFTERWKSLPESERTKLAKLPVIIDRAGMQTVPLEEVINRLSRKGNDADAFLRGAEIIVPASFGGIRRGVGLLDAAEPTLDKDEDEDKKPKEEQEVIREKRKDLIDVADIAPGRDRQRVVETITDGEKQEPRVIGGGTGPMKPLAFRVELKSDEDSTIRLISRIPPRDKPEWGTGDPEPLAAHVGKVRKAVDAILSRITVCESVKLAAELAADWHDHGKNRERWQRLVNGKATPPGQDWQDATLGKSGGLMKRDSRGYRHEFGSLCEFIDAHKVAKFTGATGKDITEEVMDLALHLIATHHGRGRPHFPRGGFDPDAEARSADIHANVVRRFARLQRRYGWWHLAWLENLLRCADALASANVESTDLDESEEGVK